MSTDGESNSCLDESLSLCSRQPADLATCIKSFPLRPKSDTKAVNSLVERLGHYSAIRIPDTRREAGQVSNALQ